MRWNIIVECVGEDGKQSTITLGTVERVAGSTTAENLGVNLQDVVKALLSRSSCCEFERCSRDQLLGRMIELSLYTEDKL
jgi:hypothetical protein